MYQNTLNIFVKQFLSSYRQLKFPAFFYRDYLSRSIIYIEMNSTKAIVECEMTFRSCFAFHSYMKSNMKLLNKKVKLSLWNQKWRITWSWIVTNKCINFKVCLIEKILKFIVEFKCVFKCSRQGFIPVLSNLFSKLFYVYFNRSFVNKEMFRINWLKVILDLYTLSCTIVKQKL